MKKALLICSALFASTSLAMAENRNDPTMLDNWDMSNFYVGGDLGYHVFNYGAQLDAVAENALPVLDVYMGYNIDDYYAIEWGAFVTDGKSRVVSSTKTDAKEYGMYVDAVGKYHIQQDLTALGTLGIQYSKLKATSSSLNFAETEFAPRLGAGLEYNVSDNMKLRGMARYVFADYDGEVNSTMQYTFGLNYAF